MSDGGQNHYPELLEDLKAKGVELLTAMGMETETARKAAFAFAELVRKEWAGQNLYIPKGRAYELALRDEELYRRFTGANLYPLCKEFGITLQRGYQILAVMREREFKRRQAPLPGLEEEEGI